MFNERNVMNEVLGFDKDQFIEKFKQEEGETIFLSYFFTYIGEEGYINISYNMSKKLYEDVTMNCNFGRPAGLNNYPKELTSVADHVMSLFK